MLSRLFSDNLYRIKIKIGDLFKRNSINFAKSLNSKLNKFRYAEDGPRAFFVLSKIIFCCNLDDNGLELGMHRARTSRVRCMPRLERILLIPIYCCVEDRVVLKLSDHEC